MTTDDCIKLKRAGHASNWVICICGDEVQNPECVLHTIMPDCEHVGCIDCRDVQCCQIENRGRREKLDDPNSGHVSTAHMRGKCKSDCKECTRAE